MNKAPAARLLDITRLIARAGRMPTGVDRVERAYLAAFCAETVPIFTICRTALGYVLLDRAGSRAVLDAVNSDAWGDIDWIGRLMLRADTARKRGQAFARRHAVARCRPRGLMRMLMQQLPAGTAYVNVGHSNLTDRMLTAVRGLRDGQITVLIHDTIPLDFPQFQRAGTAAAFGAKFARVGRFADLVIATSGVCAADVRRHMDGGRLPRMVTAHLGVTVATPDAGQVPAGFDWNRPYFVCLGTNEPRKNLGLLLDVWGRLGAGGPQLLLCGRRGWANEEVFARLDSGVPGVVEMPDLNDAAIAALVQNARGLLFPSVAEGFGLPPIEAAMLGTPVVCADLPVYGEILGNRAVYLSATDGYQWEREVKRLADKKTTEPLPRFVGPDWPSHFNIVLTVT